MSSKALRGGDWPRLTRYRWRNDERATNHGSRNRNASDLQELDRRRSGFLRPWGINSGKQLTKPPRSNPTYYPMKHIIEILIILAIVASIGAMTSCTSEEAEPEPAVPPEPHEVLKEQISQERELREEAEARADFAESRGNFWEFACVAVFVLACIAFIAGTAIGSKGRKHADS